MQLLPLIEAHLKLLQENFEKYFTAEQNDTLDAKSWILHPFTYDRITTETNGVHFGGLSWGGDTLKLCRNICLLYLLITKNKTGILL